MSEMNVKGTWKGVVTTPFISKEPMIGCVYQGRKNRGKGQAGIITGVLVQVHPDQGDATLRDKENFSHCVEYQSLKIIINE